MEKSHNAMKAMKARKGGIGARWQAKAGAAKPRKATVVYVVGRANALSTGSPSGEFTEPLNTQ